MRRNSGSPRVERLADLSMWDPDLQPGDERTAVEQRLDQYRRIVTASWPTSTTRRPRPECSRPLASLHRSVAWSYHGWPLRGGVVMQILFNVLTGTKDATRASIPLHLAVNGSLEVGDQPVVLLAGDGTEYLVGDAIDHAEGVGLPAFRDLVAKLREHEVPVYV
jgi:hypothetical protein